MMTPGPPGFSVPNVSRSNNYDTSNSSEFSSNSRSNMLSDPLDPLNAMEKSISDQVSAELPQSQYTGRSSVLFC